MRFSNLGGKDIINLRDGQRLGTLGECDLAIDVETGRISALVIPPRSGVLRTRGPSDIPWESVRRIGPEVLIVELESQELPRRFGRN